MPEVSGSQPTQRHPHELTRRHPHLLATFCCLPDAPRPCAGCGEHIPRSVVRYECNLKPEPCNYSVCESCFHLGPGEGGLISTASFLSKSRSDLLMEGSRTSNKGGSACMWCAESSSDLASPDANAPFSASSAALRPRRVATTDLANVIVVPPSISPRAAAAERNFGLELDIAAQRRWAEFTDSRQVHDEIDAELLKVAKRCAEHLHFLKLFIAGDDELTDEQQSNCKDRCLELYSPFARIPATLKAELINVARGNTQASRSLGALVGMAVGDSLGAPFEFMDVVDEVGASRSMFDLAQFKGIQARNRFRVKRGQWTDDSSMGLCLADTLLARGSYDGSDARIRFHNWWFRGYNNAFGNDERIGSVGLGGNVAQSLRAMVPHQAPSPNYEASTQDAGNGTLMRLAPLPVFFSRDAEIAARRSAESSRSTHPGPVAAAAAAFLGYAIASAITRDAKPLLASEFLDKVVEEFTARGSPGAEGCEEVTRLLKSAEPAEGMEECWNWRSSKLQVERSLRARGPTYNGYPCYPDYFGSYCIDGLAVALWSFYHTKSFMDAVVRSLNFLGDADTMAAICGQLSGAFYGYDAIDQRCIDALEVWDDKDIACRGALLYATRI